MSVSVTQTIYLVFKQANLSTNQ